MYTFSAIKLYIEGIRFHSSEYRLDRILETVPLSRYLIENIPAIVSFNAYACPIKETRSKFCRDLFYATFYQTDSLMPFHTIII